MKNLVGKNVSELLAWNPFAGMKTFEKGERYFCVNKNIFEAENWIEGLSCVNLCVNAEDLIIRQTEHI